MKRSILIVLSTTHHGFLRGIARYAREHDWHINAVMAYTGKVPEKWSGDGVISHCGFSDDLAAQVTSLGLPTVEITSVNSRVKAARIDTDYAAFGVAAAEYFLERRFKRFAVAPLVDDPLNRQRMEGFSKRVKEAGYPTIQLPPLIADIGAASIDWPQRLATIQEQLCHIPKPIAVFAYNDAVGVDIVSACQEAGLLVPEQVAVMGVDNDELLCEASPVPLSSVRFDLAELAYQGAAFLDEILAGECREQHRLVAAGSGIVTRRSSDIVAADNLHVAKACMYIMSHLVDPQLSVQAVVAHAGIGERGLLKAFVKHAGRSIQEEIALLRSEKVAELLRTTTLSTKQIAALTGFSSGNYLTRWFRHRHGTSPGQYRRTATAQDPPTAAALPSGT
ncbi:MAG: substrate-binding domain-containing protein [Verrucomicrobiota bacterium]